MLTVHHLNNSRSQRILWLLEELGLPYEIKRYQRDAATMLAPKELKAIHPLGKSPLLTDDTANGVITIAESGAIVEYILDTYGNGRLAPPRGTPEFLRYRFWLHYAEGSLMPLLVMKLIVGVAGKKAPLLVRPVAKGFVGGINKAFLGPQLKLHLDYVESELARHSWFVGEEFTAADVQMSFPLEAARARAGSAGQSRIDAFLERIHARPAYRRALEKGGPYELMS
ncbi:MAG: Glutathione S-transferase [Hydrocarboniphaga sp.]|uniref:glutathione S-transferase n=1 Tax=Hydrocarboniphaga sp. TaxID=2033016 RepID=UPI002632FFB9|nr:glutathione S-transferase [Hydrocarboniphaga sp.]MDB5969718.1 Glutathione S-transferase [Hydrocarboniphaga sp.]